MHTHTQTQVDAHTHTCRSPLHFSLRKANRIGKTQNFENAQTDTPNIRKQSSALESTLSPLFRLIRSKNNKYHQVPIFPPNYPLSKNQIRYHQNDYLIGQNFVEQNFRRTKFFVGHNFRHLEKFSSLMSDETFCPTKMKDAVGLE